MILLFNLLPFTLASAAAPWTLSSDHNEWMRERPEIVGEGREVEKENNIYNKWYKTLFISKIYFPYVKILYLNLNPKFGTLFARHEI